MSEDGLTIFEKNYPNIYTVFKDVINNDVTAEERKTFFDRLVFHQQLEKTSRFGEDYDANFSALLSMGLDKRHQFFKFLIYYPPIKLFPPCLDELETGLGGKEPNLAFEDKQETVDGLRRNDFWQKYLEVEAAFNFAKAGCKVKLLAKKRPKQKYADLEVEVENVKFNVEVSNRTFETSQASLVAAIRDKIHEEAKQLPEDGINLIIIFISTPLTTLAMNKSLKPNQGVNLFNFADALYDRDAAPAHETQDGNIIKVKHRLILETNPDLKHIKHVLGWFHGQAPLMKNGMATRWVDVYPKENLLESLRRTIGKINSNSIVHI